MKRPQMIIFDYGHTLLYEPNFDFLRGDRALLPYMTKNMNNLTPEEIYSFENKLFEKLSDIRKFGMEIHKRQFQRMVYERLGIEFAISYEEVERIQWNNTAEGACMPDADKIIEYINECGIRSAVISNIIWSGNALLERFNRLLPQNRFEFVITSSEYGFRKPSPYLFELALQKANLLPEDVWYCGDNPQADVDGAASVGIFPVWYDNDTERDYKINLNQTKPRNEHLYIKEWSEMIHILEEIMEER